jgi:CRP/FNR family transcriptional regulator
MNAVLYLKQATPQVAGASCSACSMRHLCLPAGMCAEELARAEGIVYARKRIKAGAMLYAAGAEAGALYAIRSGFFKSVLGDREGREQVTGFHMAGDLLGLEGIGAGAFGDSAVALEDSEVCVLPRESLDRLAGEIPALRAHLYAALAGEIARDHRMMLTLGSLQADERLAMFLVDLSKRLARRGLSGAEFHLRMGRQDIGSYLGLELETVSRQFSKLQDRHFIEVNQKHVRILDIAGLAAVFGEAGPQRPFGGLAPRHVAVARVA